MVVDDRTRLTTHLGQYHHTPVMLSEVLEFLHAGEGGTFIDGTCGEGGHSKAILESSDNAKVVSLDLDKNLLLVAKERLKNFEGKTTFVHTNFADIDRAAWLAGAQKVKGILLDLGISMAHIKGQERGITFNLDQPLDMRLNPEIGEPASRLIGRMKFEELEQVIRDYGEEHFSGRIARAIINERRKTKIETTGQLVEIISKVVPKGGRVNPATRTFQALRILINGELENLAEALPKCLELLEFGGTLVVISYHSLEDRIVKNAFKEAAKTGFSILTKKPLEPTEQEIQANPASRSAKLRAIRRGDG